MSNWARVKMQIKNEAVFREACERNQVEFRLAPEGMIQNGQRVYGILTDKLPNESRHNEAYLMDAKDGGYELMIDNDPYWSSLTARLGPNGGLLTRTYSEIVERRLVRELGGEVMQTWEHKEDKEKNPHLYLRVSIP